MPSSTHTNGRRFSISPSLQMKGQTRSSVERPPSAMAAGWARTYSFLKGFPGSKIEEVLEGEDWANELVSASLLAWQETRPRLPNKARHKGPRQAAETTGRAAPEDSPVRRI